MQGGLRESFFLSLNDFPDGNPTLNSDRSQYTVGAQQHYSPPVPIELQKHKYLTYALTNIADEWAVSLPGKRVEILVRRKASGLQSLSSTST